MAISIRTDEEIQADVLEELKWDTHIRPNVPYSACQVSKASLISSWSSLICRPQT